MQAGNETTAERTILDELMARLRELWAQRDEVQAQIHEIQAEIERVNGETASAEWHRLAAVAARSGKPEDEQAAHRAWVRCMALHYLKRGARPDMGSHCQAEIDEEIDRLTAEMRQ
jgi:chromosome segregation ATPase